MLFTRVRHAAATPFPPRPPTMLHVNYHPDKAARMAAAAAWYGGDAAALDGFPDGSER